MLSSKLGENWLGAAAQGLAGHHSAGGEQLHCASLDFCILILIIVIIHSVSALLKCLYLNP